MPQPRRLSRIRNWMHKPIINLGRLFRHDNAARNSRHLSQQSHLTKHRVNRAQTRCGRWHTKSAVFPDTVGPVTIVNSPSGNRIFKSFNSNRRSSSGAVKSMEIEPTSSLEASLREGSRTTVLVDEGSRVFPFTMLPVSSPFCCGTSFHLNDASSKPNPSSKSRLSLAEGGADSFFLREETWSETSSSSR